MKTAAVYCRVSTEDQEREGTSLETQLQACLKHCHDRGYDARYRFNEAYSGLQLERPKLNELRRLIQSDLIDTVIVYSLDRLTRDPVHGVILMQELEKHGVTLEAATETVDNSEVGKLVFYIKGYAAKLDAERRRDATGRGKQALLKNGKLPQGTGIGIYGYTWDKENKKRIIRENEAAIVRRIFDLAIEGRSVFSIASELNSKGIPTKGNNQWHPLTVRRILMNPAYYGQTYFNQTRRTGKAKTEKRPQEEWVSLPFVTPAIITQETFNKAQQALKQAKSRPGKAMTEYLLRGHGYCHTCGGRLIGTMLNRRYRYYRCGNTTPTSIRPATCHEKYIKADWLEDIAWNSVKALLTKPEILIDQVKRTLDTQKGTSQSEAQISKEIVKLQRRVKSYTGQHKRMIDLLAVDEFSKDDVLDKINQIKADKQADEARISDLLQAKEKLRQLQDATIQLDQWYATARENIENADNETKRLAFEMLDIKVYATREKVHEIKGAIDANLATTAQTSGMSTR